MLTDRDQRTVARWAARQASAVEAWAECPRPDWMLSLLVSPVVDYGERVLAARALFRVLEEVDPEPTMLRAMIRASILDWIRDPVMLTTEDMEEILPALSDAILGKLPDVAPQDDPLLMLHAVTLNYATMDMLYAVVGLTQESLHAYQLGTWQGVGMATNAALLHLKMMDEQAAMLGEHQPRRRVQRWLCAAIRAEVPNPPRVLEKLCAR